MGFRNIVAKRRAALLLFTVACPIFSFAVAEAQNTTQTSALVDLTQMNFYQLRQKRDELNSQIQKDQTERVSLDSSVYWFKQEANAKRDLAEESKKTKPEKQRIAELSKNIN